MTRVGEIVIRGAKAVFANLLWQILSLAAFVLLMFAWVGLGLPFSLFHILLAAIVATLLVHRVAATRSRERRHD